MSLYFRFQSEKCSLNLYTGKTLGQYDFFRLRNELDRNQFLFGNDNEWIIPDLFKVFYSNTSSGVQSCGSIEPV